LRTFGLKFLILSWKEGSYSKVLTVEDFEYEKEESASLFTVASGAINSPLPDWNKKIFWCKNQNWRWSGSGWPGMGEFGASP
jgi:hypothetical protein